MPDIPFKSKRIRKAPLSRTDDFLKFLPVVLYGCGTLSLSVRE
jgi:hypothetical protein